jgi:hypothetical protein
MGTINTATNKYEYPKMASKANTYSCPDCKKRVHPRQGPINAYHFAHHKSDNPCTYYIHPGESQIHKDAKMALKTILEEGKDIYFVRSCGSYNHTNKHHIEKKTEQSIIQLEHRFTFNDSQKIADIAYLNAGSIKYIFEICYKHKTREDIRPEPWFEINAEKLLEDINRERLQGDTLELKCIRNKLCSDCHLKKEEEDEKRRLKKEEEDEKRRLECIEEEENKRRRLEYRKERERLREKYAKEESERRRLREIEEKEKQRLKEIEDEKYRKLSELRDTIGQEIKKKIWSEHKKCIKCKSYERCKKCSETLWKKYHTAFKEALLEQGVTPSIYT